MKSSEVFGHVQLGFEPVKKLFEENVQNGKEENAQLCVFYQGKKVVDLWCKAEGSNFGPDSLTSIFSSSKSVTAIVVAWLVDNNYLSYDQKISEIWPEFTGQGKETATVAQLMRHELGMPGFSVSLEPDELTPENIKKNCIGQIIEKEMLHYDPGSKRDYHFFTRGWIINEIVRRADPRGRTVGQILREEICEPLAADVYIGVKDLPKERFADLTIRGVFDVLQKSIFPKTEDDLPISTFLKTVAGILMVGFRSNKPSQPAPFKGIPMFRIDKLVDLFNTRRDIEVPSAGSNSSARGLAKLGALMAGKGTLDRKKIISENSWNEMHKDPTESMLFSFNTSFSQGGVNNIRAPSDDSTVTDENTLKMRELFKNLDGFVGWMGLGGSIFQWHPELEIGFAYVPTLVDWTDFANTKGLKLQEKTVQCVKKLKRGSVLWMNDQDQPCTDL